MNQVLIRENLRLAARRLLGVLADRESIEPFISKAKARLMPLIDEALGQQEDLPKKLDNFFFGMHEDELAAHYLNDVELMNCLSKFERAIQAAVQ